MIGWHAETLDTQTISPESIPSAEAFGGIVFGTGPVVISPVSIPSAEAFGGSLVSPGTTTVHPVSIPSAESFGVPSLSTVITVPSIMSAEFFGTPSVSQVISPTSISSLESFGVPEVEKLSAPVTFMAASAVGRGGTGGTPVITVTEEFEFLVAWVFVQGNASSVGARIAAESIDLESVVTVGDPASMALWGFVLENPPVGSNTISFTGISGIATYCASCVESFSGVSEYGPAASNSGTGLVSSVTTPLPSNGMASNAFGIVGHPGTYNKTERGRINQSAFNNQGMVYGDTSSPSGDPVTFTDTRTGNVNWYGAAIPLY